MAEQLQKERSKLFKTINERDLKSCRVVGIYFSPFSDSFIYLRLKPKSTIDVQTTFVV
jgi:hypothetical protein